MRVHFIDVTQLLPLLAKVHRILANSRVDIHQLAKVYWNVANLSTSLSPIIGESLIREEWGSRYSLQN